MNKEALRQKTLKTIEENKEKIMEIGDTIYKTPEVGYREYKTAEYIETLYTEQDWTYQNELAITGSKAYLTRKPDQPTVALAAELDSLDIPAHPDSDPKTGWVHACGHNAQVAAMIGAAIGINPIIDHLDGNIALLAIPAEELIQIEYRNRIIEEGKINFMGGKQEFIHIGALDDIEMTIGSHSSAALGVAKLGTGGTENGFIAKIVAYKGKAAHAGDHPDEGINALNAALLGIMGAHANRETFRDADHVRFHPIITKGGEIVNNVPAEVTIESFVRGATVDAIKTANKKVNNALQAGAMAVGATVDIHDIPGYMPYHRDPNLDKVLRENVLRLEPEAPLGGHSCGSVDFGDFSCVHPTTSLTMAGVTGRHHHKSFKIIDKNTLYMLPAKALALTVIDLLYEGAAKARKITEAFTPITPKNRYREFMQTLVK